MPSMYVVEYADSSGPIRALNIYIYLYFKVTSNPVESKENGFFLKWFLQTKLEFFTAF